MAKMMPQEKTKNGQQPKLKLRDALNDLKSSYQVDIMFELKSVEGLNIPADAINRSQNIEKNLEKVLTPLGLKYRKVNATSYLIVADKKQKKTAQAIFEDLQTEQTTGSELTSQYQNVRPATEIVKAEKADRNVSGKVTDEKGEGLPGVSIVVKGTQRGTTTDTKGVFELSLPEGDATLIFSFVGYLSQEITAGNKSLFDISLVSDAKSLEEMVVVGYGSSKKKDLTGAVTRVDLEQSRLQPNVNPVQGLRGTVAGVTITDNGRPGSDASITIRGRNSISASNSPLIVLDGIIYAGGSLSDINSNDIESIDILKDASSSAIYGSLAANGVILITTKKGSTSKPRISINSYFGTSDFAHAPDYRNAEQYLQARKDAEIADKGPLPFQLLEEANIKAGITIDPWEEIKRKAPISSNELSVSGRTERVNYYFSGSYTDIKSPVKGDNFNRVSARINLDVNITDWLSIGTNSGYSVKDNSGVRVDLAQASQISPYANLYYEDGVPRPLPMNIGAVGNPLTRTLLNRNYDVTKTLFTNTYTDIKLPLEGLTHRLNIGFTQKGQEIFNYTPSFKREQFFNLGSGNKKHYSFQNLAIENILRYDKTVATDHVFNFTFLYGTYVAKDESSLLSSTNIFNDVLGYNGLEIGENFSINTDAGKSQQVSTMGRIGYRYKGKYILDLTMRRDGYSAFGDGKKYGLFPAIGVSWNLSDEAFMANIKAVDNLKLRTSWGKNGNRGVDRYSSLSEIRQTNYVFGDGAAPSVGLYTYSLGNPNLGWETTVSTNFGVDVSLFSGKISGSVDYYQTRTKDLLLLQSIPNMTGFTTFLRNIGQTKNKGLEVSINTTNLQKAGFVWNTRFVFTLNRNKITKLTGNDLNKDGVEDDDITSKWFIGHPLGSNFDYVFDGIYQTDDDLKTITGAVPGAVRFKDLNGDGAITPLDRQVIGSSQATFTTGITNTFSYKGLSLMVLFNIRQGGQSPNATLNPGTNYYDLFNTLNIDYWTPENRSNTNAAINYRNPLGYAFYQDRSFVRLQDVSLSYDLPSKLINRAKIQAVKVYVSGKNLVTWTEWNGWDPEHGVGGRSPGENGPLLKTFTLGLNIQL
ncbi:TonB-dependent receptor [Dyadobacter psychrotolerans]|uniref:TonB-dependent receptor n=2 Tax=Dyadobacter psychrotolerans TaxID=2541721 RepID=A0A4R5E2P5_9BACT|nr:TonB-dependent receptor [Dyadobacter psychrotolerans]